MASQAFEKWALGYSGCDGGDIGNPQHPSTWVCGIEWGGGHSKEDLIGELGADVSFLPTGYADWEANLAYIYNWQVMKLLTAIKGGSVKGYKEFAKQVKPFVKEQLGFFKTNLYPIGFKDTDKGRWLSDFAELTGFQTKQEYIDWCKNKRFLQMYQWVRWYQPKLIICLGKTYKDDFIAAFANTEIQFNTEVIDEREISWAFNEVGSLVVILPFMVNRNGLVKNVSIQKVGERIADLLKSASQYQS